MLATEPPNCAPNEKTFSFLTRNTFTFAPMCSAVKGKDVLDIFLKIKLHSSHAARRTKGRLCPYNHFKFCGNIFGICDQDGCWVRLKVFPFNPVKAIK